jgi:hypothetical protein
LPVSKDVENAHAAELSCHQWHAVQAFDPCRKIEISSDIIDRKQAWKKYDSSTFSMVIDHNYPHVREPK